MKTKREIDKVIKQKIKKMEKHTEGYNKKELKMLYTMHRLLSNRFNTLFDKISHEAAIGILRTANIKEEDLEQTYATLVQEEKKSIQYKLFTPRDQDKDQER